MDSSILVVGLQQHDSGKTTVSMEIIRHLRSQGIDTGYTKPFAAFNAWMDYHVLEESLKHGFPVSGDAVKVKSELSIPEEVQIINPVCTVLSPLDPEKVGWNLLSLESTSSQLAALRVTGRDGKVRVYEVEADWDRFPDFFSEAWNELRKKTKTEQIDYTEFEHRIERSRAHCDFWMKRVARKHEVVVVESSSNISAPSCSSIDADIVVAVTPGRVFVVDGGRYARAIEVAGYISDPWKTTAPAVLELVKPEKSFSMRPGKMNGEFLKTVAEMLKLS
ncbi:hypothetical protein [Geoglobus sp.]